MKAKARSSEGRTGRLATGVGWVSLGLGAVDLILGAGLLRGRRRSRWMLARAILNAVLCLIYARVMAEGRPRRGGPAAGAGLMAALTLFDYSLSRRLRVAETL